MYKHHLKHKWSVCALTYLQFIFKNIDARLDGQTNGHEYNSFPAPRRSDREGLIELYPLASILEH